MDYVVELTKATDSKFVGGKGANLGKMLAAGISVPPGFAITVQAFNEHVHTGPANELIARSLRTVAKGASVEELEILSNEIRRTIRSAGLNDEFLDELASAYRSLRAPFVAVRSSATVEDGTTAAWAGQLETYLYIDSELSLHDAVLDCWASLYAPRAISYRLSQGLLDKPVSVAIVVQQMIVAVKSGVAFTVDPITNNPDITVVEAVWGDCEQLVSGAITPDSYHFDKKTDLVKDVEISPQDTCQSKGQMFDMQPERVLQRKMEDGELLTLSRLCERIETYFGRPQDIEWVYDGRTFYIVQARPITTFELPKTS